MRDALYVLIACEESQVECTAWRALGHHAYSCDIQPCTPSGSPDWHIQGDVTPFLHGKTTFYTQSRKRRIVPGWDLIIAHPPCTYLTRSSACQMFRDGKVNSERLTQLSHAKNFFMMCLAADATYVAVENPVPLKLAGLPTPTFYTDPSWFGDRYTKKTCYWCRNLPPILAEKINPNTKGVFESNRGKYRSRTSRKMALAMAVQWSDFILSDRL